MSVNQPTDQQLKDFIVLSVGDINGIVQGQINLIWDMYAPYAPFPPLQYLFSRRSALTLLAGQVWQQVNASVDDTSQSLSDKHKAILDMIANLDAEIQRAIDASPLVVVVSGAITATTPTTPPPGYPDANDPRYSGSPYVPYGDVEP